MKRLFSLIIASAIGATLWCSAGEDDRVLLTIDNEPVTAAEFLYIYEKNNNEQGVEQKSIDEYLDLFVNFKLKVKEAENRGLDTMSSFRKELASYRKQAVQRYLQDTLLEEQMVRLTYDHIARDRRAAHIAIECPLGANDSVQAAVKAKIDEAYLRVTKGIAKTVKKGKKTVTLPAAPEDFFAVASEISTDPSVAENKGELGWIMPLRYVWPFEKAVYSTPVGSVTEPFRTQYGWHIALVEEEREHEEVHARHIMKMVPRDQDSVAAAALAEIQKIHAELLAGADFEATARDKSDDRGSAMRGGDLGWFGRGVMVKPFEDAAFALDSGKMSEPFRSRFGWHIVLNEGRRGMKPYDEEHKELKMKVKRDERYQEVQDAYVEKLRKEYALPASMPADSVVAVEDANLENKHAELRHLIKEYHDGILLFDVSLSEVWDKASLDTAGLTRYFKKHKKEYKWDKPRFKGYVVYCKDEASAKAAKSIIKSAKKDSVDSYIKHRINNDSTVFVRTERGLWAQGVNKAVDKLQWKQGEWAPKEEYPIVFLSGKILKAPEEYMDERTKVVTAYQDELEKKWVESLRAKYKVEINRDVLESLR